MRLKEVNKTMEARKFTKVMDKEEMELDQLKKNDKMIPPKEEIEKEMAIGLEERVTPE